MNDLLLHKRFMLIALAEAKKGLGRVSPNPAVGCIIVKEGKIVSKGYHQIFGGPHAEIIALKRAKEKAYGATIYVTLEPCSYFGKTPPCIDAIIISGIKKVVVAMVDPNPANSGKGLKKLRREGIKVISGILKKEAEALNKPFIDRMKKKRPYVTVKLAQSLDGKIATKAGDSKWISSKSSRTVVQRLRSRHDAIMVGVNTVLKDDPSLSVRISHIVCRMSHRQPTKIVIDSKLKTPVNAKIFQKPSAKVIIAATKKASQRKEKILV
ncbi:MAG: bifunctional diaminohydroxyphosphoribosylaminopyrimidine deaminase/5-amino-6-(5-phosphoribosylamino)uracil reductase RibD, partial [Candidatus Omnitrophota bacterium]